MVRTKNCYTRVWLCDVSSQASRRQDALLTSPFVAVLDLDREDYTSLDLVKDVGHHLAVLSILRSIRLCLGLTECWKYAAMIQDIYLASICFFLFNISRNFDDRNLAATLWSLPCPGPLPHPEDAKNKV